MRPMLRVGACCCGSAMRETLYAGARFPFWLAFEQPQTVLELSKAKLQFLVLAAGDEAEVAAEPLHRVAGPLAEADGISTPAGEELLDPLARLVTADAAQLGEVVRELLGPL